MPQLLVSRPLIPSHSVVDTDVELGYYWACALRLWGVGKRAPKTFHPASNPCSLAVKDLSSLRSHDHVLALKSDGVRYALMLTMRPKDGGAVALMIDRAKTMYEVEVLAPEAYFQRGTLLEGELVARQPDEKLVFLVFDAVCIRGEMWVDKPFSERLEAASKCTRWSEELAALSPEDAETRVAELDAIALVHFEPHVTMRPKRFVDLQHAARVWSERNDSEHRVDGLIVHRADAAYKHGTATGTIYKWKHEHTIDLLGTPDALHAADAPLPSTLLKRRVVVDDSQSRVLLGKDLVTEFHVNVTDDCVTLFPMRRRPDKTFPNGLRVVQATVQDVIENLQPEDLAA